MGVCPCWECLGPPWRGSLKLFWRLGVFQVSGTSHWLSLPVGEKVHLCKEVSRKEKGILKRQHSYSSLLFLFLCFYLLFSLGDRWVVQCHSGSTLLLSQNNLPNCPWPWGENWIGRAWSSLCKHSIGKHFLTSSARVRCSNSSVWVLGMDRRGRRKGHTG